MLDDLDLGGITDAGALSVIARLLNVVEEPSAKLERVTVENQRLRDENNRLEGEQPRPRILPARPKGEHSSERERRETLKAWHKGPRCRTCQSTGWRSAGWTAARCRRMRP